ncbi:hypothetical protein HYH03_005090 [Edaphochlamys debaryana]|uniref:Ribonuclease n=1 Tax=Edaphochlamys debaryana TaxID=47281 RepID=A0A835Y7X5_9CHLO|nr:hypothetical protein HYH03_005090 [Edaphochlamys debaryana]|eukprot:KAG2496672.1 hypothetical protein HYH03_005090 [Edaphochlamys debaryana]
MALPDVTCSSGVRLLSQLRSGEEWIKEPCILGVDEAGRGPVLGPMVYASAFTTASTDITGRGYADSKTLTHASRSKLFGAIDADRGVGWVAHVMSAEHISAGMLGREKTSLNAMAFDSTLAVIRTALDAGVNLTHVYVDTVGDAGRHRERLMRAFPGIEFTVCPKADSLYPIVSAASIVAKVLRDKALTDTQQSLGLTGEVGTGYPGDSATTSWLRAHLHPVLGFPRLVRHSWETCNRLLEPPEGVTLRFEADEAEEGAGGGDGGGRGGQQQKLSFARAPGAGGALGAAGAGCVETSGLGRATYFRARKLQRVAEAF